MAKKETKRQASKKTSNTQKHLEISEIREDVVVMKDGTIRAVVLVSSINFALKADEEQQALISSYVDFINSFENPFQIVIQSRKLNMEKYLLNLASLEKNQTNELLKTQMQAYRQYVKELVELGEIMTKRFYVVLSYAPVVKDTKGFFYRLRQTLTPGSVIKLSKQHFAEYRTEMEIRVNQVIAQLASMGLKAIRLDTQSLIELYYTCYNPTSAASQPFEDINTLQVETSF